MKKRIKGIFFVTLILLFAIGIVACDNEEGYYEDYESDESYEDWDDEDWDDEDWDDEDWDDEDWSDDDSAEGDASGSWWGYDEYEEASAEIREDDTGINWSQVQSVSSHQEAASYLKDCMDERMTTIPIRFTDGYDLTIDEFLIMTSAPYVSEYRYEGDGYEVCLTYDVLYYPGTRIADAYSSGDTSALTSEEMQVYQMAVQIVEEIQQLPSDMHKQLLIHDRICEMVQYYNGTKEKDLPDFCTALGVFLNGEANCQGYADAFYMLGTMAGLRVDKQTGFANNEQHVWNIVEHSGNWYAVDLTWNDDTFSLNDVLFTTYKYFNVGADLLGLTHSWEDHFVSEEIVSQTDGMYFYFTSLADENWFGQYTEDVNTLVSYAAQSLMGGDPLIYIMGKGFTVDANEVAEAIGNTLYANGYSGNYSVNVQTLGNHCYLYVDAVNRN